MNDLMFQKGLEAGFAGDWEIVEEAAVYDADTAAALLYMLERRMPPELKYRIAREHYSHHGDEIPIIRRFLRENKKYRPENWRDELPEAVRENEIFTVYRAGCEPIEKAQYRMSWTLSRDVAEWFANRHEYLKQSEQHIYRASIMAANVIAYIGGRSEFEIVQYRRVKNIVELPRQGFSEEFREILRMQGRFDKQGDIEMIEYVNRKLKEEQK